MYRRLDEAHIVDTLRRLELRIGERFPGSGLGKVSAELLAAATESVERIRGLRRPNLPLRIGAWTLQGILATAFLSRNKPSFSLPLNRAMRPWRAVMGEPA